MVPTNMSSALTSTMAGGAKANLARIFLGVRDEIGQRLLRQRGMDHEDGRRSVDDPADLREIADRTVRDGNEVHVRTTCRKSGKPDLCSSPAMTTGST
jgi:hypothetical protein